jgi:hypothetical protein
MPDNYLLQLLQQSGQVPSQEAQSDPSQFQSVQDQQPPSAPAYSGMADLQSQQPEPAPQRVTQPPPSALKSMLMGYMHQLGQSFMGQPGPVGQSQIAHNNAQTQHLQSQDELAKSMVPIQLADGTTINVPAPFAKTALGAAVGGGFRVKTTGMNNDTSIKTTGMKTDSQETIAGEKITSNEKIAGGHDATRIKVAQINGSYGLQRAAARKAAAAQDEPAQVDAWLEAVGNGMPLDKVPLGGGMRGKVLVQARMSSLPVKFTKLPAGQQKMSDSISDIGAALDDGLQILEAHKGENSAGDYGTALLEGAKYKMGIATDDPLYKQINKIGNFVKIIGATPYTQIGRGKYLFEEIQKHLPQPGKDTPQLMYEKMQTLHTLFGQMQDTIEKGSWKQMGGAPKAPNASGGPKVGDKKTFPNGAKATWDGNGWAAD